MAVSRARWREFPGSPGQPGDPGYLELLGDLVRPYGMPLRPDATGGHSYGEMLAELIGELVPPDQPADGLILGFALPDARPERATATFLSHVCPGRPVAFALCDQGCAAGFTALRLARDYAAGGGWPRVLVALAEQPWLGYDPPAPVSLPARAAAFAMLCDAHPAPDAGRPDEGGGALLRAVRICPGVPAEQVPAVLRRELAALPRVRVGGEARPGGGTEREEDKRSLVLGEGLVPLVADGVRGWPDALPLPPGQPVTGTWRELAAWAAAPGSGGLVIADYDPGLRYLCLAEFAGPASRG